MARIIASSAARHRFACLSLTVGLFVVVVFAAVLMLATRQAVSRK
jgi:hypothetical protein